MVAQQIALDRPLSIRRMILVPCAPRGGDGIMRLEKPSLAMHLGDPTLKGYAVLPENLFCADLLESGGRCCVHREAGTTKRSLDAQLGPSVAAAQMAAFP